jgi:nuclear protein localization protein 4 homolog
MLLRFESKQGQFRLNVEPTSTFGILQTRILANLPSNTEPSSIILSNKPVSAANPNPERERRLADLPQVQVQQVGLK